MFEALEFPFFQRALVAGLLASVACGLVGALIVVRRIATISGGLSHSAFGGVGVAYFLGLPPLAGATVFGVLSALGIGVVYRRFRQAFDTLIAVVWSVGMAVGIIFIALTPGYAPDLNTFLFGNILVVTSFHVWMALILDLFIVAVVLFLYKELRAVTFDEEFAQVAGIPVEGIFLLLLALIALAVVVLINVVGVVLVIALLTLPASAARLWVSRLSHIMVVGIGVGAVCTTTGLFASYWLSVGAGIDIPTGPMIILLATAVYAVAAVLSLSKNPSAASSGAGDA